MKARVLFIDNFDSFTYNIAHLFIENGSSIDVLLNDHPSLGGEALETYDGLVLGPGPGTPRGAPGMMAMLEIAVQKKKPVFGVCLGLQAIAQQFGAKIVNAPSLMHGKTSLITHSGAAMFAGVAHCFRVTRYHSLCVADATLPAELEVTARSGDGVVQGLAHRSLRISGVQFHPESVLSEHGHRIVGNFLQTLAS